MMQGTNRTDPDEVNSGFFFSFRANLLNYRPHYGEARKGQEGGLRGRPVEEENSRATKFVQRITLNHSMF